MTAPFSGWRAGAPFYAPVLAVGAGLAILAWAEGHPVVGLLAFIPGLSTLAFFRDPPRTVPSGPSDIVSPADGHIVGIDKLDTSPWYSGPCVRVSIFLSVLDVHVNRCPADATILRIEYRRGAFKNAMATESSDVNEANALWLDTPHGPVTVRQIAGLIARRIVCPAKVGENLRRGERFGMIRFGSRTELFLPPDAEIVVHMGQMVRGASTVVAHCDRRGR